MWLPGWACRQRPWRAGRTGAAGFPPPAVQPVHLVSQSRNPLEQPGVGRGEGEMRHTTRGPRCGLARFIRPGAAPPGCPTAAPSAYPKGAASANGSAHSIRPFVRRSLLCLSIQQILIESSHVPKHCCGTEATAENQPRASSWGSWCSCVLVGTGNKQ